MEVEGIEKGANEFEGRQILFDARERKSLVRLAKCTTKLMLRVNLCI